MNTFFTNARAAMAAHKIWTAIAVVAVLGGGFAVYRYTRPAAPPQYTLSRVRTGSITQTVTGTGQVSAQNQLDVTSQVSGEIDSINVSVGQHVDQGDLIATIDPTNAENSLENAKLALAKLTEAPKATDVSDAQDSLNQSYDSSVTAIGNTFTDLQTIIPGMNSLLYGNETYLSLQESDQLNPSAQALRTTTGTSFDKLNTQYNTVLAEYQGLTRSSASSTVSQVLSDTYALTQATVNTVEDAQDTVNYLIANQPDYLSKDSAAALTSVTGWLTSVNGDLSSILSAQNGITSAENALTNLNTSIDPVDLQSAELAVQEQQQNYDNYFITAPFSGVIGRIPVNVYGQASGSTVIATVVGDQKIATLSLDEVDAATVKAGDPVTLTFDAINNFTAQGTVEEVDLVGTVTSGVVTYGVKVLINTSDPRIDAGMSVNATIVTNQVDNVLVVPAGAIKTQGNKNYVQIFTSIPGMNASSTASTTARFARGTGSFASSTASTTRQFTGGTGAGGTGSGGPSLTISSAVPPTNQTVTVGATDDTNTQILSGLTAGEWVVTKITAGTTAKTTTAAPSLLSSLGAGGRTGAAGGAGGGGFARGGGGGGAAALAR